MLHRGVGRGWLVAVMRHAVAYSDYCAQNGRTVYRAMRIIVRRTLREFVDSLAGHKDQRAVKLSLDAWFEEARKARWRSAAEVRRSYATASIVTAERVVFNIKGNAYRLVVAVDFEKHIIWIKWVGTHKDYDRIDVTKVQYEK